MILILRCLLSVANTVKNRRKSSTAAGSSTTLDRLPDRREADLARRDPRLLAPRAPQLDRHADRAVAQVLALGGERRARSARRTSGRSSRSPRGPARPRRSRCTPGGPGTSPRRPRAGTRCTTAPSRSGARPVPARTSPRSRSIHWLADGLGSSKSIRRTGVCSAARPERHRLLPGQPGHELLVGYDGMWACSRRLRIARSWCMHLLGQPGQP